MDGFTPQTITPVQYDGAMFCRFGCHFCADTLLMPVSAWNSGWWLWAQSQTHQDVRVMANGPVLSTPEMHFRVPILEWG